MHRYKARLALGVIVAGTSLHAIAATDADIAELRREIDALKQSYEARIHALEQKLEQVPRDARGGTAARVGAPVAAPAVPAEVPPADATATAASASPTSGASGIAAFNPAISLVLQGAYSRLTQDPNRYAIAGFQKTDEVSPGTRSFSLGESELTLSANVDDKFAGVFTASVTPDNSIAVEEAYGFMPSLPYGFVPKFGRFLSGIGYLNEQHQHVWDFYDAPLAYDAILGGQHHTDGVQVKWVAPTDQFVEVGADFGNGNSFPGSARNSNGLGSSAVYVHTGDDIGASHSWRAGLSYLDTRARDRSATQADVAGSIADVAFSGKSRVAIADFVWKYAPNGNSTQTNFKLQGEYLWRRETGELTYDPGGIASTSAYSASQSGWYVQGVWQFQPGWRVGARYDRLDPGSPQYGANADLLDSGSFHPERVTGMLDWSPSEFTRWRLQLAQARTLPGVTDNQLFIQYILTLGAHGAHRF